MRFYIDGDDLEPVRPHPSESTDQSAAAESCEAEAVDERGASE